MGVTLHLGFDDSFPTGTKHDGKSFMNEIIRPSYPDYFNLDEFLTQAEQKLFYPEHREYPESFEKYRHIDPQKLKSVFIKVYDYLRLNHEKFPLVHFISENDKNYRGSSDSFIYKGYEYVLDGFHHDYTHRGDLYLIACQDGPSEWIRASNRLTLGDKIFYIQTENKFEQFRDILQELIDIYDEGIISNRNLFWIQSR